MAELNNKKSMITHLEEIIKKTEDTLSERQKDLQASTELESKKLWLNQLASDLKEILVSVSDKQEEILQIEHRSPITESVEGITSSESDIEVCIVIPFNNRITVNINFLQFIVNI